MENGSHNTYKKKNRDTTSYPKECPGLIPLALAVLPEIPSLIPEAGCGQRPHIVFLLLMPDWYAEKSKNMYKHKQTGNTIIKEEIRQRKTNTIRQQMSTYLIFIKKDFYP